MYLALEFTWPDNKRNKTKLNRPSYHNNGLRYAILFVWLIRKIK